MHDNPNDRPPNYWEGGRFFLKRCFVCMPGGKDNFPTRWHTGQCLWCGWSLKPADTELEADGQANLFG